MENNIDTKKICITSSSVLSIYGIRDYDAMNLFINKKYIDILKIFVLIMIINIQLINIIQNIFCFTTTNNDFIIHY